MNVTIAANALQQEFRNAPRMVSPRTAAKLSGFPESCIRALIKQNRIPGVQVNRNFWINYDRFLDFLNGEEFTESMGA